MKYLIQAILIDGERETVFDSIKSDDYETVVDMLMKKHRHNNHYLYCVLEIETRTVVFKADNNKYY